MTGDELFSAWAPDEAIWSPWAKPVLFAHADDPRGATATPAVSGVADASPIVAAPPENTGVPDTELPSADGRTAVVVDLPGATSVEIGLRLAVRGFRPVTLFNGVPPPRAHAWAANVPPATAVVDVVSILNALAAWSEPLRRLNLPAEAPPAFLLDSARRRGTGAGQPLPGLFDNRSVSLPTDYPSGNLLRSKGIDRLVLVQPTVGRLAADLCHTLVRWQRAGIGIVVQPTDPPAPARGIVVRVPGGFGLIWQRALATLGLRRSPMGGFGGFLPDPGSGG